jgi:hypothetical protein
MVGYGTYGFDQFRIGYGFDQFIIGCAYDQFRTGCGYDQFIIGYGFIVLFKRTLKTRVCWIHFFVNYLVELPTTIARQHTAGIYVNQA